MVARGIVFFASIELVVGSLLYKASTSANRYRIKVDPVRCLESNSAKD
jgi:hypothetical protein